ncbi:hypothetical protein B0H11DRAFT_1998631, partial [Mycena galericulata]
MSQMDATEGSDEPGAQPLAPILPPEIEREIFETTARFPRNAVQLVLVARRTQIWIERLIYETVTLADQQLCDKFLRTLETRPPQFFTDSVKSLCVPGDIELLAAERVLEACQGVINLAIWLPLQEVPLFPFVCSLQPKRLSINVRALYGNREPDFAHPFFSKVTHLELIDWLGWKTYFSIDCLYPHLTHLALDLDTERAGSAAEIRQILVSCRSLVICVGLVCDDDTMIVASNQLAAIEDPRLVILSESNVIDNWEASLRDADASMWVFAETIVVAKTQLV